MPSKRELTASVVAAAGVVLVVAAALRAGGDGVASRGAPGPRSGPAIGEGEGAGLDYEAHIDELRKRWPGERWTVVVAEPFVVIGDERPEVVRRRARQTVGWAVTRLKAQYFDADPDHIIDIWLLKDKASYEAHVEAMYGRKPHTPFGFYHAADAVMVMNIATGGGTLVHEIVHPFVAANFPGCPAWFNEGLGSLYEQSASRDGRIMGLTNWRLAGLQEAIEADRVMTFEQLTGLSTDAFYGPGSGTHYAQARYLCMYLQEQDKLEAYYRAFLRDRADDPTGYGTLVAVMGEEPAAFEERWRDWVMTLRFP